LNRIRLEPDLPSSIRGATGPLPSNFAEDGMNEEIRTYFELEATELVDRLTRGAAELDGAPATAENISILQRAAHTLKGAAHVVGEVGIAALAHDFEDSLAQYRDTPEAAGAKLILDLTDALNAALVQSAKRVRAESTAPETPAGLTIRPAPTTPAAPVTSAAPEADSPPGFGLHQNDGTSPQLETPQLAAGPTSSGATVRVNREEVAKLLQQTNVSGDLVAGMRASLAELDRLGSGLAEHENGGSNQAQSTVGDNFTATRLAAVSEELHDQLHRLERQMLELHRAGSQLSLVSTGILLIEAGRIARATASATGCQVTCVTHGGGDRIDLQVVEVLQDAVLHLVRNAVVHGIESPAERQAAGKPALATITVGVVRSGSDVILTCADDGRGIDLRPIRAAAVERGLYSAAQAENEDHAVLLALLLRPDFTTRAAADHMAGRGVGLDAVQNAAERLHGEVRIASKPGAGSTFTVTAPRTLFSLAVLEVTADGSRYALPVEAVEQSFILQAHHTITGQALRSVLVDREPMPYLRLQDLMPGSSTSTTRPLSSKKRTPTCVVVRTTNGRVALAVDRVESSSIILMQPLPAIAGAANTVAGAALSPGGQPFLVLNPAALLPSSFGVGVSQIASESSAVGPILVIDDSLTTRMLEQSILEAEDYSVDLAVSAEQGLAMARQKHYSLFLVDVEMPGMNGFDFVRAIKADPELSTTPCILVTSLDSAEDRERGRMAGAVSYVVKGEFNQQVYLNRIRAVMRGAG
jgi:two-component system chemotaxis sensor kinase CheA